MVNKISHQKFLKFLYMIYLEIINYLEMKEPIHSKFKIWLFCFLFIIQSKNSHDNPAPCTICYDIIIADVILLQQLIVLSVNLRVLYISLLYSEITIYIVSFLLELYGTQILRSCCQCVILDLSLGNSHCLSSDKMLFVTCNKIVSFF